eukprot:6464922-Amphidinium_carterae.2
MHVMPPLRTILSCELKLEASRFDRFVAQHAALTYYWLVVGLFLVRPSLAYNFSLLVEDWPYACLVITFESDSNSSFACARITDSMDHNKEAQSSLFLRISNSQSSL